MVPVDRIDTTIRQILKRPEMYGRSAESIEGQILLLISLVGDNSFLEGYAQHSVEYRQTILKENIPTETNQPYLSFSPHVKTPQEFTRHFLAMARNASEEGELDDV